MLCLNIYLYIFGIEIGFKNDISYNFNYKLFKWSSFWSNIEELFALCNFYVGSDSEVMWCVTRVAILSEIFLTYYSGRYWHYSSGVLREHRTFEGVVLQMRMNVPLGSYVWIFDPHLLGLFGKY